MAGRGVGLALTTLPDKFSYISGPTEIPLDENTCQLNRSMKHLIIN